MKKSIRVYYICTLIIIFGVILFGISTKNSFVKNDLDELSSNKFNDTEVSLSEESQFADAYFKNDINNLEDLSKNAELIVVGNARGVRELYNQAIKTPFTIKKVIKNNSQVVDLPKEINIFEPNFFNINTYISISGYNIMQDNKEYIVFLNHLVVPKDYKLKGEERFTFLPTSTYFGKFNLESKDTSKVLSPDISVKYSAIKDYGILTTNQDLISKYKAIEREVMAMKLSE